MSGPVRTFTVSPNYDRAFPFEIFCPFKDASTECQHWIAPDDPSDLTEHLLYDRLGAWEMPTIDIIDLECGGVRSGYQMSCTFGTWNWYDLEPTEAKLTARLRARDSGLFQVVKTWDIPFGPPLAHNDTRPYTVELGDAVQWVADYQTNDFYVEIVAQRPDNPASMSHLMTHVLIHPVEELRPFS